MSTKTDELMRLADEMVAAMAIECATHDGRFEVARAALRSAIQEVVKDAERYRWLRSQPNNTDAPRIDVVYWTAEDEAANSGEGMRLESLDAAIDAAMKPEAP